MMISPLAAKHIPLHLITLNNVPILEQLRLEEALLRADDRNWCLINSGSSKAIVMGISGKPELLIDSNRIIEKPIPIIRRFSGGGTVVVDPNTIFITWICNVSHSGIDCCPKKVHSWGANFCQQAFPFLGMKLLENDFVLDDRKFGGNAQYLCKGRWLHHSSLLWDYDPENMQYLNMPQKTPAYRRSRTHDDFLCRLNAYFEKKEHLVNDFLALVKVSFEVKEIGLNLLKEILNKPHRTSTELIAKKDC